jgi:hypothetical protein
MNSFESMQNNNPTNPENLTPEELAKKDEARLSPSALTARQLMEEKFKEKMGNITETEVDEAFAELQLSPEDFLKANMNQIKDLLKGYDVSQEDARQVRMLTTRGWQQISMLNDGNVTEEIKRFSNYLLSVEQYLDDNRK